MLSVGSWLGQGLCFNAPLAPAGTVKEGDDGSRILQTPAQRRILIWLRSSPLLRQQTHNAQTKGVTSQARGRSTDWGAEGTARV